jgi:predicted dehydrogenase
MADRVRLVVAGAGGFGREHLRILAGMPEVTIAGIADIRADAAAEAQRRFGAGASGSDALALIDAVRPDGVIVATPGPTHAAIARHALALGIPVLVEKPVAMNAAEAKPLAMAAAASGSFVLPGHILRFSAAHRRLVVIARSDAVGPILSVTARRHRDDSHARRYADDPVLMTMVHDIDLALWLTGTIPGAVLATRRPAGISRSETLMTGTSASGAVWRLATAWTFPTEAPPADRIEVVGERGSVELEAGATLRTFGAAPRVLDISGDDPDQPHKAELAHFIGCIRGLERPETVTLADAMAGLAVVDATLASLRSGAPEPTSARPAGPPPAKPGRLDRRRSDPAARLAWFLHDYRAPEELGAEARRAMLQAEIAKRFPGLSDEERIRGYRIATEIVRAETMEMSLATARLKADLRRRKAAKRRRKT